MTPTESHAAMQLPFGANASRLAAFTGKLIDIAFHQSGTLESHLERRPQFLQGIAQGGPQAAELVEGCFLLHATTIYRIQIRAPQSEKSTALSKMFSDDRARLTRRAFNSGPPHCLNRSTILLIKSSQWHAFPPTSSPRSNAHSPAHIGSERVGILPYLSGRIPGAERTQVKLHLKDCRC